MAFAENIGVFFDEDDFAVSATFTPQGGSASSVKGIFDAEYAAVEGDGQVAVSSTMPVFHCASASVPNAHNGTLAVNSKTYRIVEVKPDGTGVTILALEDES
jgi:hypothetical protein